MFSVLSLARRFSERTQQSRGSLPGSSVFLVVAAAAVASAGSIAGWRETATSTSPPQPQPSTTTQCLGWLWGSSDDSEKKEGDDDNELFHGQCLKRQMHKPAVPYPLWDYNWDGRMTSETTLEAFRSGRARVKASSSSSSSLSSSSSSTENKSGDRARTRTKRTRHLLLVRHGQYDEQSEDDKDRKLTPLGRRQAIQTGKRLVDIAKGATSFEKDRFNGGCSVKAIHVSNMERAKETAALIAQQFDSERKTKTKTKTKTALLREPDPLLNEALPAPMVPIRPDIEGATEEIDEHHDRIEAAFRKYFYRDSDDDDDDDDDDIDDGDDAVPQGAGNNSSDKEKDEDKDEDEFEVIVCHGNVIRYFFCRALQLPPEAWLRLCTFNCSITYLVIRPNGMVSARMMGDIGHLEYDESTFSGYHGFKW